MLIVIVRAQVKPEWIEAFKAATLENARQSVLSPASRGLMWRSKSVSAMNITECHGSTTA